MRRLCQLLGVFATLVMSTPAAAVMTVDKYLAISRGEVEGVEPDSLLPYLIGVLDAAMLMADLAANAGTPIFCIPESDGADIDVYDVQRALDSMLAELEVTLENFDDLAAERSVGLATVQLLTEAFPCRGGLVGR